MNARRTIFSQLLDFIPRHEFDKAVKRYGGNRRVRTFSCFDQFLCMAFAQLTSRESLRDIEICLRAMRTKLYHCGFRGKPSRSTLANANERRDFRIFADFANTLIQKARLLYCDEGFDVEIENAAYVFDTTFIDLCLTLFPWAQFRRKKSAVKLHTLLDLRGNIPCAVYVTGGQTTDVTGLDFLTPEAGAFYIFDRAYTDFRRLYIFTCASAFFVTRAKRTLDFGRREYRTVNKSTGLRSDYTIILRGPKSSLRYPVPLRRIGYFDSENETRFVFLTNNFTLPALTIAELYKCRWQIELFFKWVKQHLRIKSFFGTSPNAVKVQIWIAFSVYVLISIVKKELKLERSMYEILQILSISLFEKVPLRQALTSIHPQKPNHENPNQLRLFNL